MHQGQRAKSLDKPAPSHEDRAMGDQKLQNVAESAPQRNRASAATRLGKSCDLRGRCEPASEVLSGRPGFIVLDEDASGDTWAIPEHTVFEWFARLNFKLAEIGRHRLTDKQLNSRMTTLRKDGSWNIAPGLLVGYGERFGFIASAWTPGQFVFPISHLLSFVLDARMRAIAVPPDGPPEVARAVVARTRRLLLAELKTLFLQSVWKIKESQGSHDRLFDESLRQCLSYFDERVVFVVKAREGLLGGKRMTLEETGALIGVTKERVRQIESKFWNGLGNPFVRRTCLPLFLVALLSHVAANRGSVVLDRKCGKGCLVALAARWLGIPVFDLADIFKSPDAGWLVLGSCSTEFQVFQARKWVPEETSADAIANRMDISSRPCLMGADLRAIAETIPVAELRTPTKAEGVEIVLRRIGRPAHYSRMAREYNRLFPHVPMADHKVHAVLKRQRSTFVWVGTKGVYALKEWGYERPSKGLFETVAEITGDRFARTGKPVPYADIVTEMGKHRAIVKASSLWLATRFNPSIRNVGGKRFTPA